MLTELQTVEKVVAALVTISGAGWGAWRVVIRPRVVCPAQAFFGRVGRAVDLVEAELRPNGGTSLKDEVRIIGAQTQALTHMFDHPVFEANLSGEYVRINRAYRDMTGYGVEDLAGWGWVHTIHPDDRDRVVAEWAHTVSDRRMCTIDMRIVTRDNDVLRVRLFAEPMRTRTGVLGWLGTVHPLKDAVA